MIDEALTGEPLSIALDGRLVRITRDDFLSGHREEAGFEIVGGGPIPRTSFWFVVDPSVSGQATAAWVEQRRTGSPEGVYREPTQPLRDLVEIVDPGLTSEETSRVEMELGIGVGDLPVPDTDISVEAGSVRYHLIADADAVFLLATGAAN